jgi:pimeloyl-ACP methyl ester carboxylesterase
MEPYQTFEEICKGLAARPETWAKVRDEQKYMPLLPLLEHPYSLVATRLVGDLVAAGLPRTEVERISLGDLVVFALAGPAKWAWGGNAVSWIEAGFPVDDAIASALERVAQDKRFPQRVRHRAFAVAKRWRRAHATPAHSGALEDLLPRRDYQARLVLLPGLDGTGILLRDFRKALGRHRSTILVSYPADPTFGYAALKEIARSRLPKRKPFVLLAESFSGPIAISLAADHPAGLRGLILICSFARNPLPTLAPLGPLIRMLPVRWAPVGLLVWPTLGRFVTPTLRFQLREVLSRVSPSVFRKRLGAVVEVDVTSLLARVDVPVLCLVASEDRLVPRSASDELAAISRIRFAEIEGPHFLLQVSPSAAAAHVEAFLRELEVEAMWHRREPSTG